MNAPGRAVVQPLLPISHDSLWLEGQIADKNFFKIEYNLTILQLGVQHLRVETPVNAVLEDMPREREDHRRVLFGSDDVLMRPRVGIGLGERPLCGFDEVADVVRKGSGHETESTARWLPL